MRKANQKEYLAKLANFIKGLVCGVILFFTTKFIFQRIERYNQKGINKDTYCAYCSSIWYMLAAVVLLLVVWHFLAYSSCKLRECLEKYTLVYAVMFVAVCFGTAIYINWRYPGIERVSGTLMPLKYVFCYPCAFAAVLFGAAPGNICKVIIPYFNWIKWIVAGVFLAALYLILKV